ncbi:MAG: hypothetical protein K8S62_11280 [Candidatus Sabulitectum sp.]|nr:hypothetical protein [Candidatus Sabulitectum sp.]
MSIKQAFKMLAPYFAVGIFWCIFSNAWLAIFAYHLQILLWARRPFPSMRLPGLKQIICFALPAVIAGPLFYFILPSIIHADLFTWLADYHLSGLSLVLMIPYFGIVHPYLEQLHWAQLREDTPVAHPLFAGYHIMVLYSLLTIPWLIACFAVLTAASLMWRQMRRRSGSSALPVISHALADTGIIIAAFIRVYRG